METHSLLRTGREPGIDTSKGERRVLGGGKEEEEFEGEEGRREGENSF